MSSGTIKNKALDFAKYHNGFVIGLMLVFSGGAAIFAADPGAREAVLGKEIVSQTGVDNAAILAADLDNFDFEIKINEVAEDENNYYVDYSFRTLEIQDNIWQEAQRRSSMAIDKLSLAGKDLGLYVQEQLVQVAQNEQNYLKQVQAAETKKGPTQIARAAEYTGLIGLVLDAKNAILPGYDPVVKPAPVELTVAPPDAPEETADEGNDNSSLVNNSDNQSSSTGTGGGGDNNSAPTANSNNQPSGTGGSSDNQPSFGNGTTTEEAITPASEPSESSETPETSESPEPSETPESPETPETSESSEPSESSETPESPEPSATEPAAPEPEPAPEPEN
ncbi:MAG TPA: hypothetical protein PLA19_01870 [Candidatus Pacearchaeota archaeon]|nr:hypothetical protein [Candidatus Pacearchaeota archaeon]